ncbi:hypothetical protein HII12_003572 [Brettanomyces bruxellensis]|uniref:Amino acid permease n=1 Tax=Dekkera bruxellensis TaxID=5007 RepID=A0A8H6ETS7_DEKBR|nr:hypothetical protein HII12_003572 [Brettanomyces bruxellensis]
MSGSKKDLTEMNTRSLSMDSDAAELAKMGYKQEFSRHYGFLSTFSFALSISGLMGTISITYMYPLISGGPAAGVWCWFIGSIGCLCIAWSVAEITSCFPTSGDFGAATLLLQTISMHSDYSYIPSKGQTTAVAILIMLSHALLNSLPGDILSRVTKYYCIINIGTTIALIVTLLVKCPKINTAEFTFTKVVNSTGWDSNEVSWVMTCYDATSRISEEVKDAALYTPLAIASALTTTAVLGWVLNVVITLTMGTDVTEIINGVSGQPIVEIYLHAMGKTGATAFLALAFLIIWFTGATATCYTSRSLWSFARDRGLPFSDFWHHITPRTGVPTRCVWLVCVINCLLTLINLGSTIAMNAIFSACAICTDWSYILVIFCFAVNARKMGVAKGPFNLKKLSHPIMFASCVWTVFVSIVFVFPNYMPVTKENMNYTVVILAAVFFFSGGWYLLSARKWYSGPVANVVDSSDSTVEQAITQSETNTLEMSSESDTRKTKANSDDSA